MYEADANASCGACEPRVTQLWKTVTPRSGPSSGREADDRFVFDGTDGPVIDRHPQVDDRTLAGSGLETLDLP